MAIAYFIVSAVPILLLAYVWHLDRLEREPVGLVAAVFLASALLGTAAAAFIEEIGALVLEISLLAFIPVVGDLLYYFGVVALVEEFCKRLPVMLFVWNNRAFDHRFDAIVYCVASAIGFAVAENFMYVGMYGAEVAVGRLIPVHAICGLFMGYYLGCAKICERGGNAQARAHYLQRSLLVPVLIHGGWDFCVSMGSPTLEMAAMAGILALSVFAFFRLKKYVAFDAPLPGRRW